MKQNPRQHDTLLRFIGVTLVLVIAAAFIIGVGYLFTAGLYIMSGNGSKALSQIVQSLFFFAGAYLINILVAFIFTKRWNWRGLQLVLEKPAKKPSAKK